MSRPKIGSTTALAVSGENGTRCSQSNTVCQAAPIDAFGVGTRMGVSADAPYLDSVYKLVAYGGRPVIKLATDKVTLPGAKQAFRGDRGDVIGLRDEQPSAGREPLLAPVMEAGHRLSPPGSLDEARSRFEADLDRLPEAATRIVRPEPVVAEVSEALARLTESARADALRRTGTPA